MFRYVCHTVGHLLDHSVIQLGLDQEAPHSSQVFAIRDPHFELLQGQSPSDRRLRFFLAFELADLRLVFVIIITGDKSALS